MLTLKKKLIKIFINLSFSDLIKIISKTTPNISIYTGNEYFLPSMEKKFIDRH